jgi:protein required for attachment to host cells
MSNRRLQPAPQSLDWVLIANAARARCFERDDENNAMRELGSFVHPQSRLKAEALGEERGGLVHKGVASTQYAPRTSAHEREHAQFARELAHYLEEAALAHRFPGLALIASNPFLGELRAHLGDATRRLLKASVAIDLTSYSYAELERRVAQALRTVET